MKIINYKIYLRKRRQRISFFSVSPSFDWKFILIISILLFVVGATYISMLYFKILNESLFIVPINEAEQKEVEKKEDMIEKVVEQISNRIESSQNVLIIQELENNVENLNTLTIEE